MAAKYCTATFQADSRASPPPDVKKTRLRSPGASAASLVGESDAGLVAETPEREVAEFTALSLRRRGQLRAPVSDVHGEEARQSVEVTLAGVIEHPRPLAAHDDGKTLALYGGQVREVPPEMTLSERDEVGRLGCGGGHAILREEGDVILALDTP